MSQPVFTFDFTLKKELIEQELITKWLECYCKKWAFQLEKGQSTDYEHYQGRFSLKEKKRLATTKECLYDELKSMHLSPTSKQNCGNNFYVMKEDTRVDGPWTSEDGEAIYIPRQIRGITLRPWQQQVVDDAEVWNTRNINWVYDQSGNHGKSILKTYVGVNKIGRALPFFNDFKDICRMVMATKPMKLYLIDLPRAIKKDHLYQFLAGVETLKDGYAFDDRYTFKEMYFDCPNIWIFSNTLPDFTLLSKDRWVVWIYDDEEGNTLVRR